MLPHIDSNTLTPVFLLGIRLGGLMTFAPFLGDVSIPPQIKAGLTFVLTALLAPIYSSHMPQVMPQNIVAVVGGELMVGLGMGLTLMLKRARRLAPQSRKRKQTKAPNCTSLVRSSCGMAKGRA